MRFILRIVLKINTGCWSTLYVWEAFCLTSAVGSGSVTAGAAILWLDAGFVAAGIEGVHGEIDLAEHIAGTFCTAHIAGLGADLGRDTVIEGRDQKLGIPFQSDNGELTDGHEKSAALAGQDQFVVEPVHNALRQGGQVTAIAAAVAGIHHIGGQDHGIHDFYHSMRHGAGAAALAAIGVGEHLGRAVAAEEQGPFGEYGKAVDSGGTVVAHGDIGYHAVVEGDIQGVEAVVIGDILHLNIGVDQFHTSGPCTGAAVQNTLTVTG